MAVPFCTRADLELALGGADVLRQLADPNRSGQPQDSIILGYLLEGASELRTASEVKHDPETLANLDADSLDRMRRANTALSARIAYEEGGRGLGVPDHVERRAARAETFIEKLRTGEARLGRVAGGTSAPINQDVGGVDYDSQDNLSRAQGQGGDSGRLPHTSGISIASFRANGFR
jgi:hypothetical protein